MIVDNGKTAENSEAYASSKIAELSLHLRKQCENPEDLVAVATALTTEANKLLFAHCKFIRAITNGKPVVVNK